MRLLTVAALTLSFVASCGGESDDGGRQEGPLNGEDAGAEEDDDRGRGDDDAADEDDDNADDDEAPSDDDAEPEPDADDDANPSDDDAEPVRPEPEPTPEPAPEPNPSPTPVTPAAEDCMPISLSTTTTSCDIREQCTNAYKYTYCSETTTGEWSCQCSDGFVGYQLEVSANSAPCEVVAEACPDIGASALSGELSCELELQSSTVDYCETQERCSQSVELNPDISVVQSAYRYTSCYTDGAGGLTCSCSGPNGSRSFVIADATAPTACGPASALCSGSDFAVVSPETCTVNYEYAGSGYCQRQQTCSETVAVDGVEATLTGTESGSCSTNAEGGATCSCYNSARNYSFEIDVPADDPATCLTAMSVCDSNEAPVAEGPIECTLISQSASTTSCNTSTQCTQDAVVEGLTIGLYGTMYTYCQPDGDSWLCTCSSGVSSANVTVAAEDAWAACTDATAQCPDLVDVQVTTGGSNCYSGTGADIAIPCAAY
jgi:hypothetical protein